MKEYLSNNKNNKNNKPKNFLILILIITACIIYSYPIYAEQSEPTPSLQQISEIINSYPDVSPFQADQLLKEAKKSCRIWYIPQRMSKRLSRKVQRRR